MKPKWLLPALLVLLAAGLIAAFLIFRDQLVSVFETPTHTETITPTETHVPFLGEGEWVLESLNGKGVIPGAAITMMIKKSDQDPIYFLSSTMGCNYFVRNVVISGNQISPANLPLCRQHKGDYQSLPFMTFISAQEWTLYLWLLSVDQQGVSFCAHP